jgi:hypothetical protein
MKLNRSEQIIRLLKNHIFRDRHDLDIDVHYRNKLDSYYICIKVNYNINDGMYAQIVKYPNTSSIKQKIRSIFGIKGNIFITVNKNFNKQEHTLEYPF